MWGCHTRLTGLAMGAVPRRRRADHRRRKLQAHGRPRWRRLLCHPDLVVDPRYALQPAVLEWSDGNLNAAADRNDIRTITCIINGGYIGLGERQHWFDRIWPIASGTATPPPAWQAADADEDTRWLQESLNHLGVQPQLLVDGRYGPATTAAVKWFQGIAGIPVDGVAGDVTRAALRLRLTTI